MKNQEFAFLNSEGDQWFLRNKEKIKNCSPEISLLCNWLLPFEKEIGNILEIGSRTSILTKKLSELYCKSQITICDTSQKILDKYSKEYTLYHIIDEKILLNPYSYDLVVSSLFLHRIVNKAIFLQNIKLLLSDQAIGLIVFFGSNSLLKLKEFFIDTELRLGLASTPHILPLISLEDITILASKLHLNQIVSDSITLNIEYSSAYHLMKDLQEMGESYSATNKILSKPILKESKNTGQFFDSLEIIFLRFAGNL